MMMLIMAHQAVLEPPPQDCFCRLFGALTADVKSFYLTELVVIFSVPMETTSFCGGHLSRIDCTFSRWSSKLKCSREEVRCWGGSKSVCCFTITVQPLSPVKLFVVL